MFMELWRYIHAFMHPCFVRVWFLCGGENGYMIVNQLCETSVVHPMSFVEASQKGEARRVEQNYKREAM